MDISKYVEVICTSKDFYLFNRVNSAILKIDKKYLTNDKSLNEDYLEQNDIELLQELHMLASSDHEIIELAQKNYSNNSKTLIVTIELTRDCNLYCSYCYENGMKFNSKISSEVMEDILTYIRNVVSKKKIEKIKINFMGGEPLLAKKELLNLYTSINAFCNINGIELHTVINTNGVLLNSEFLSHFKNTDLSITLSNKEDHDNIRAFVDGSGSFDIIVQNLIECNELFRSGHNVNLFIRYNTSGDNYKKFGEFLDYLVSCNLYVKQIDPMYTYEYDQNKFRNTMSKGEFLLWNSTNAIDELISHGYKIYYEPLNTLIPCKAYIKDNCKVYANGKMALCDASEYDKSGPDIKSAIIEPELFNRYYSEYKNWNPFGNSKCKTCKELFSCGGDYFCRRQCNYERYDIKEFLKTYLEYRDMGMAEVFVNM